MGVVAIIFAAIAAFALIFASLKIRESRQNIKDLSDRTRMMFDATPMLIGFWDEDMNCLDANTHALTMYGLKSPEEYIRDVTRFMPDTQPCGTNSQEFWRKNLKLVYDNHYAAFEFVYKKINGELIFTDVFGMRMEMNSKPVLVTYSRDVTHIKRMWEEREKAMIAEENNRAKSRFLAQMSHEIRTPITAVLGIAEIQLQDPELKLETEEAFSQIYSSGNTLLHIVNDILDISRIEAGKMKLLFKKYEIIDLLNDVIQLNKVFRGSKNLDFVVDIDSNVPASLIGDGLRIKQVLNNLLSNAFKYTEKGMVTLSVHRSPCKKRGFANLAITIRDTGKGMSDKQRIALFDEYTRFHEKETQFLSGTGLGMPITSKLLEMMDGTIEVQSEVGVGTSVFVVLPQQIEGSKTIGAEAADALKNLDAEAKTPELSFQVEPMPYGRILIVDDIPTNLYVSKGLMGKYQLQIETVDNALSAIEKIKNGDVYDIIFMDQMMPEIDGMEATARLRNLNYTNPIVALTANALVGQAEMFMQNGFDDFLSKPIQSAKLNKVLNKFVKDRHPDKTAEVLEEDDYDYLQIPEIAQKIREDFAETQSNIIAEIIAAITDGDMNAAYRLAHSLKGFGGLLGDKPLATAAEDVEKILKIGNLPEGNEMEVLEAEVNRVLLSC